MPRFPEDFAALILITAVHDQRAGELLECLFEGGSVTLDARTHELIFVSGEMLAGLTSYDDDAPPTD